MKAWNVHSKDYESGTVIVFAETSGKAKALAMRHYSDQFEYYDWIEIRVTRCKELDRFYDGDQCPDFWENNEIKTILVRDLGWFCSDGMDYWCDDCNVKEYCCEYDKNDTALF